MTIRYKQILFWLLAGINIALFFPGFMSPDSYTTYQQAVLNHYSDPHPPLMAYLWHYLDLLYTGPALMFLFNISLLWSSIFILTHKIFKSGPAYWFALSIPFIPHILIHSGWIWKDIIFTFGYGLLVTILALQTVQHQKLSILSTMLFWAGLIYFTAVKFQAQFIAPWMILWYFHVQSDFKNCFYKTLIKTLLSTGLLILSIQSINSLLINTQGSGSNYSWQYVKIYDLSGMSYFSNQVLVPDFLLKNPNTPQSELFNKISEKYTLTWDPLISEPDSPIRKTDTELERRQLLTTWRRAILTHPIAYVQHRGYIWTQGLLLSSPLQNWLSRRTDHLGLLMLSQLIAFIFLLPIQIFLFLKSLKNYRNLPEYKIIFFLNSMGLSLLGLLFFFSLAAAPRYIYFTIYLFFLSIPFYLDIKSRQRV